MHKKDKPQASPAKRSAPNDNMADHPASCLFAAIAKAQENALGQKDVSEIFGAMLDEVLAVTDSTFGFIGEVLVTPEGQPFLKTYALSNIAWNDKTLALYEKHLGQGLEFCNLDTLFGAVLKTGQPVIANAPGADPRSGGLPVGHPPLEAFLGLPVYRDDEMVGLIGLANRPGGYDQEIISFLTPLLTTCATLITSLRNEQKRRRTENELRKNRQEWEDIFQAIGDYVLILNPDHTIAQANRAVIAKTGMTAEELIGRKCYELFHGTEQPPLYCPLEAMAVTLDPTVTPMEVEALGGTFLISCTPLFDEKGNLDKIIHIATDITATRKAARALADSEKRFRAYFDHAPIGMAIVGLDEGFLQVNDAICRMLGYSRETLLGKTVPEITHPDDRQQESEHKRWQWEGETENFQLEKRYLHSDGHIVWGLLSVSLLRDAAGAPEYYLGQLQDITARRENEQGLRQAKEEADQERARADAILAAIGDPITIQDRDFKVVYQNKANREALGDHQGEFCYAAYEGRTEVCDGCALAKAFVDGMVHKAERNVTIGNETRYYEITASPVLDKNGQAIAGIELARDITGRKQKEILLAEQIRLLSLSSDVGAMLTKANTVRAMLTGCCELLVQHLGAAFARVWLASDPGDYLILQASAGLYTHIDGPHGRIAINEKTKIGAIGSTKKAHITNEVIGDPGVTNQEWAKIEGMVAFAGHPLLIEDHLVGVIGMFFRQPLTDSTSRAIAAIADEVALGIERGRSEERLRRSNRALRILSRCNEALISTDSEQELLDKICNIIVEPEGYLLAWVGRAEADAAKTIIPVAQAGFDDGYLESIQLSWDDSEFGRGPSGTAIRTGKPSVIKDIHVDPKFSLWRAKAVARGYASSIGLPLVDSTTKPIGSLSIYSAEPNAFDEEEIKLLSELAGDLSFGINGIRLREERGREQEEKQKLQGQLRQAQKLEAIGTLAGGIAHDFNNILAAILGYSELVQEEVGPGSKAREDLQQVITAAKRAVDLVRQILTISRQSEQQRQLVKVQDIIAEALKLLRPSLSTSIEIKTTIDANCPEVFADSTEIHQVIMNLCTNAYYAMRKVEGRNHVLEVGLAAVALDAADLLELGYALAPGCFVKLKVADTGSGMDAATMAKVFDPYFTTKKQGEGTGLGLATVHSIVTGSGGAITVASESGAGTVFTVYLPAAGGDTHGKEQKAGNVAVEGGTERIMVVDDEEAIAHLLHRTLAKLGYQVTVFTRSDDAMRIFTGNPAAFDLVISDMNMPVFMGVDLARAFLEIRPELPIILCTGFSDRISLNKAKDLGIREMLTKPVDRNALIQMVRKIMDGD